MWTLTGIVRLAYFFLFSSPGPKGHVRYCHHFASVISEEKIFLTVAKQKQELPLVAIFVGGTGRNE
jgi:hypothetical protein